MTSHRSQWQTHGHPKEVELGAQDWGPGVPWRALTFGNHARPQFPQSTVGGGVRDRNPGETCPRSPGLGHRTPSPHIYLLLLSYTHLISCSPPLHPFCGKSLCLSWSFQALEGGPSCGLALFQVSDLCPGAFWGRGKTTR